MKKSFILKLVSHDYKSFHVDFENSCCVEKYTKIKKILQKSCTMRAAFYVFALEVEVLKHESVLT
ncbi:hypothetical protein, partial [Bartonella sp. OC16QHHD]|uniref:hypothetical protein n=1 Tax=Bartonella sp. OC16QHHD TaxID=3243562 RepID=UPI0035CF9572